jgi:hypothetical protein
MIRNAPMRRRLLPRMFASVALGTGCGGMPSGTDAGRDAGHDAGCMLPSDFPPDASQAERDTVCQCVETPFFHCPVEGGPRCASWVCFPQRAADGGYNFQDDGGVVCLC